MGARLRDDAAAVRFRDFTLGQVSDWPLGRAYEFFKSLRQRKEDLEAARTATGATAVLAG